MSLSLKRFEDRSGESAGYWLVKQLPGVAIEKSPAGHWAVHMEGPDYYRDYGPSAEKAWGEFKFDFELLAKLRPVTGKSYSTRGEALMAVEKAVAKTPKSLPELIP